MDNLQPLQIDGKVYEVTHETETDDMGNQHEFIVLRSGEDVHKLSPNTTAEELARYANPNDIGHEL